MLLRMLSIEAHPPRTGGFILKRLTTPLLLKRLGNKRASLPLLPLTEDTLIAISDVHGVPTQGGDNCRCQRARLPCDGHSKAAASNAYSSRSSRYLQFIRHLF